MTMMARLVCIVAVVAFGVDALAGVPTGKAVVNNTETPTPTPVATRERIVVPPYDESTENAGQYCRLSYRGTATNDFIYCLYAEIEATQSQVSGSAIKVIHRGRGDGMYIGLLGNNASGYGYEAAGFGGWQDPPTNSVPKQENLFLGSFQGGGGFQESVKNQGNTIAFHALVHDDASDPTSPTPWATNYGLFFANNSLANAFVVRVSQYALNYPQFKVMDYTANQRPRWQVYGDGTTKWDGLEASAGTPNTNSPELQIWGRYWTGSAESSRGAIIKSVVTAGTPSLYTYVGTAGAETLVKTTSATGESMQNHAITDVGGITMQNGGTGLDMQLAAITNITTMRSAGITCASLPGAGNAYTVRFVTDATVADKAALCIDDGAAWVLANGSGTACCP